VTKFKHNLFVSLTHWDRTQFVDDICRF